MGGGGKICYFTVWNLEKGPFVSNSVIMCIIIIQIIYNVSFNELAFILKEQSADFCIF